MTNPSSHHSSLVREKDDISLSEVASALLRRWRLVIGVPLLFALLAGVWTLSRPRMYSASVSFVQHATEGRQSGGVSALAQRFGVNVGSDQAGQSPQFYSDLVRSITIRRAAVEAEYDLPGGDGAPVKGTLIRYYQVDSSGGVPPWRGAADLLRDRLFPSVNPLTGVVQVAVHDENPQMAERIAEKLLDLLNQFSLGSRQSRAQAEGRFLHERLKEAEAELMSAENLLRDFLRRNKEFRNSPDLTFEHERLQRQVSIRQEVYTSLLRSQDQARIDAVRDTPLLVQISGSAGSAEPLARRTVLTSLLALILGLLLAAFVAVVVELLRSGGAGQSTHYIELQRLARETWADLRQPSRWIRRSDKTKTPTQLQS